MVDETTEVEEEEQGGGGKGSLIKKLVGVLAIFGTVFAALFWWRKRGSGTEEGVDESDPRGGGLTRPATAYP